MRTKLTIALMAALGALAALVEAAAAGASTTPL
jgi:hypothetical protein